MNFLKKAKQKKNIIKLVIGIAILLFFLKWVNLFENLRYLRQVRFSYLLSVLALMFVSTTLRGVRFYQIARGVNVPISLRKSILANYASAMFALVSPGRLGEGGKVFFLIIRRIWPLASFLKS